MIIEIDTINIFHVLGFAVNIHTVQLFGINIKHVILNNSTNLAQQCIRLLKPATLGEQNTEVISLHQVVD